MIKNVETHLICGFLGAGKTSAIAHLLSLRPADERWAVLVNEFGEIGLDQSLLTMESATAPEVEIQQVPGGCMCCAAGVPMVVALNKLLAAVKPDRLFIEPTGLGHPKQVLAALLKPEYQGVLDVQGVTTLVDARVLSQPRYRDHDIFRQQIEIADLILASKADLYLGEELAELNTFLSQLSLAKFPTVKALYHAKLPLAWLPQSNIGTVISPAKVQGLKPLKQPLRQSLKGQLNPIIMRTSPTPSLSVSEADFFSLGWQFDSAVEFDQSQLMALFSELEVVRIKGVINTVSGAMGVNQIGQEISITTIEKQLSSKIEFIFAKANYEPQTTSDRIYKKLMQCCIC